MKTTLAGKELSKIGIGTYGIGGRGHRDVSLTEKEDDIKYINAVSYSLTKGSNFAEISAGYGHGNAMKLFAKGLANSSIKREDLFLTNSLYPRDLSSLATAKKDLEEFYKILNTDYADSILVTQSFVAKFGQNDTYVLLHEMLDKNRARYVSISNSGPLFIKAFKDEFGDNVFAHEGHLSFEVRALEEKGVFRLCNELDILNIVWRPLRRNRTMQNNWELLSKLSEKYDKTQNQIVLNWICSLNYYPMVMSANPSHIDENLASTDFTMSQGDYEQLTNFRPSNYNPPEVDWEKNGNGDSIVTLVTDFEKHLN